MKNSKDCAYFMDIFYLKLFCDFWRIYVFVYSNWNFVTLFFISLPKYCFFLCSSSNNIYAFMCKYRYIYIYLNTHV